MEAQKKEFENFLKTFYRESSSLNKTIDLLLTRPGYDRVSREDVRQTVIVKLLSDNKKQFRKAMSTSNPESYLRKIITNTVKDMARKESVREEASRIHTTYFRKKVFGMFNKSDLFRKFSADNGRSWLYTRTLYESHYNLILTDEDSVSPPLPSEILKPYVQVLKKAEKVSDMAEYYLDYWEKLEQKQLAVKIDDFLGWIYKNIITGDVYSEHEETSYGSSKKISTGEDRGSDENIDEMEHVFNRNAFTPEIITDRYEFLKLLEENLNDKEKICLKETMLGKTYKDMALTLGYRGPSGAKSLEDTVIKKLQMILRSMGYIENNGDIETLEDKMETIDILSDFLNFSDMEPL